jgi:hypothetical protein
MTKKKAQRANGGLNSQRIGDRAGISCGTVRDAALVLDAIKGYRSRARVTCTRRFRGR